MTRRPGFSLLEVLLAMAILMGSLVVLSELAAIGRRHIRDAEDLGTAERICQTKIGEILAGIEEPVAVEQMEVADEPGWLYSVETESLRQAGLISVRVTVVQDLPEEKRPREFSLVRWVRDPGSPRGLGGSTSRGITSSRASGPTRSLGASRPTGDTRASGLPLPRPASPRPSSSRSSLGDEP
jgi:hypothetical protein